MSPMKLVAAFVAVAFLTTAAWGKASPVLYKPGAAHKMHFPQLPDPNGWDVAFPPLIPTVLRGTLGDDWQCMETGPVHDIHLWVSFRHDLVPNLGDQGLVGGTIQIWSNVAADGAGFSHPGEPLWTTFFDTSMPNVRMDLDGTGDQGWLEPPTTSARPDHTQIYQISLVTDDSFTQTAGEIYWLTANLLATDTTAPGVEEIGWKTSIDHFQDAAVYYDPVSAVGWSPLADLPPGTAPLDLAFVITPIPEPATVLLVILGAMSMIACSRRSR